MSGSSREYCFDTLRGILIFLVVFGHALTKLRDNSMMFSSCLFSVIYSFHMPAFIFISGYFSKNIYRSEQYSYKIIKSILIPFIIAHLLMWLMTSRSIGSFFNPRWTLWYLLSLFFWKILVVPLSKIRFSIMISFIISILIGFSSANHLFSLSRTVAFFPFFLIGYKTVPSTINKIRKIHKVIPTLVIIVLFSIVILMRTHSLPVNDIFQLVDPYYAVEGISTLQAMFLRMFSLLIGFIITLCLLTLVPQRYTFFSRIGKNTMTIYLGHSFFLIFCQKIVTKGFPMLIANEWQVVIISFVLAVIICLIFGNQRIVSLYDKLIDKISSIAIVSEKQRTDQL